MTDQGLYYILLLTEEGRLPWVILPDNKATLEVDGVLYTLTQDGRCNIILSSKFGTRTGDIVDQIWNEVLSLSLVESMKRLSGVCDRLDQAFVKLDAVVDLWGKDLDKSE